jgi:hypothetical protein
MLAGLVLDLRLDLYAAPKIRHHLESTDPRNVCAGPNFLYGKDHKIVSTVKDQFDLSDLRINYMVECDR